LIVNYILLTIGVWIS